MTTRQVVAIAIIAAAELASANLFASDAVRPSKGNAAYQYEPSKEFVPTVGWCLCHRLSFPCLIGQYEISQHFLFGKTNEYEIKFPSGLCHPGSLLCIESCYEEGSQMLCVALAETDDGEEWSSDIVDALQPHKGIDEFTVPLEGWISHVEWDETTYWGYDEDTRKADFFGWISTHRW